jgi:hypothetical protein
VENLVKYVLERGGSLTPLLIPSVFTKGTGLFNPSIYYDNQTSALLLNLRHCQYTLYHSEKSIYEHEYGPLVYLNPENDITLTTTNYLCNINDNLDIENFSSVDTSKLDVKPIWEFIGLEDARVVRWDDKLYLSGVRRDTTINGQGRMELSEVVVDNDTVKEVSRKRIPAPGRNESYCEKNWMPVIDMPYHYVKWCNPTEVVKFDPVENTCQTVHLDQKTYIPKPYDYRGGSQVIPYGEHRIALGHIVNLYESVAGRKNATYKHAFVVWDKNWNVIKLGDQFDFMRGAVEFCAGMTEYNGDIIVSFGFQDNAAYLLRIPKNVFEELVYV